MFLGERNAAMQGSGLASVYNNDIRSDGPAAAAMGQHGQLTPPDDFPIADETTMGRRGIGAGVRGGVLGWLEIWDYDGGSSFRGFVAEDASRGTKSLFVFFDAHSISRDLKKAYVPSHLTLVNRGSPYTDSSRSWNSPSPPSPARTWSSVSSGRYPRRKQRD